MNSGHKALPGEPLQWQCLHSSKKDRSQIHVPTSSFHHHTLPGVERPASGWEIAASKITKIQDVMLTQEKTQCMQRKMGVPSPFQKELLLDGFFLLRSCCQCLGMNHITVYQQSGPAKHAKLPHLCLSVSKCLTDQTLICFIARNCGTGLAFISLELH